MIKTEILIIFFMFLIFLLGDVSHSAPKSFTDQPLNNMHQLSNADNQQDVVEKRVLENRKLQQEILKLELENKNLNSFWHLVSSNAAFLTTIVALLGVFVTVWKQIDENQKRKIERNQAQIDESKRQLLERFSAVVDNFGSESEVARANAAISILSFLQSEYDKEAFAILLAALKIDQSEDVKRLLISAFEKAAQVCIPKRQFRTHPPDTTAIRHPLLSLTFSHTDLRYINLQGLNLQGSDIGFVDMRGANLSGADLFRVRGWRANLEGARLSRADLQEARLQKASLRGALCHDTNLVSADFKKADLRGAQFQRACLQAAHFHNALLVGARFEGANLKDTFFIGAKFSPGGLKSILRARYWQKAHFDKNIQKKLEDLAR